MSNQTAVVVVVAIIVAGLLLSAFLRQRRSATLKQRFGPEYDHLVKDRGETKAEREMEKRAQRVEKLTIHPLPPADRDRYAEMWRTEQARFVDDPRLAIHEADHLVEEVMRRRGYPIGDFEQRAADISVDHPHVVENYRAAHTIAQRLDKGNAATEDLRQAMIHYRTLFEDLLEDRMAPEPARG
jgi:hypothetical protein